MTTARMAVLVLSLTATGCASVPGASEQQLTAARNYAPSEGKARIYIWRPGSMVGAAITFRIEVDSVPAGRVSKGTFLMVEVNPGMHTVAVRSENTSSLQVQADAGRNYFVKVWPQMGVLRARAGIELSTDENGRRAVESSRMAQPDSAPGRP